MRLGDLFHKQWICSVSGSNPCTPEWHTEKTKPYGHEHCSYRYVASLNDWEYEKLRGIKIL